MKNGLFKFKYGEEIISDYEDRGEYYFIKNSAGLIPSEEGGWLLMIWEPYSTIFEGFMLPKSEVWYVVNLSKQMDDYYTKWKKAIVEKYEAENNKEKETKE